MTDWKALVESLVVEFKWNGCTCTFPREGCCAYSTAEAALARDRDRSANADRREAAGPEGQEPGPKASPNLPHDHITRKAQP